VSRTDQEAFALKPFLQAERARVQEALGRALEGLLPFLDPRIREAARAGTTTGGKRLRPILCMTAYQVAGGADRRGVEDLAVSLELIHAYSLMHDDLPCMDDAPLRRGQPTPHTIHGEAPTVVAGAAMIPAAHLQAWRAARAMGLPESTARSLVDTLALASGAAGMVGGQGLDLMGEGAALSADELDRIHRQKTGALLTASLRMGGLAAEASPRLLAALEDYGRNVGLAFQITDDVLDATSDAEALGKAPSDAALEKSTYVTLFGVDGARARAEDRVERARAALAGAGLHAPALDALAHHVVARAR
jgi:geranylgeranyl pyrophosphate synthase